MFAKNLGVWIPTLVLLCAPAGAVEKAAYDSNGRITALLGQADDMDFASSVIAVLPNGRSYPLQVRRQGVGAVRDDRGLTWTVAFTLPDGGKGKLALKSDEDTTGLHYSAAIAAETPLEVKSIDLVFDLPRAIFLNGKATPQDAPAVSLLPVRPLSPVLYRGQTAGLRFTDSTGNVALEIGFDKPAQAALVDRWDSAGRSFQVRAAIAAGPLAAGATAALSAALRIADHSPAPAPVHLALDTSKPRFHFDGFGGDYCFGTSSPIAAYTLDHLKIGWARVELKARQWDRERGNPGPEIRSDLETMRRLTQMHVPFVMSVWWLPERFYTDAYEKPRSEHFRIIDPEKWDDLLDLLGSYLLYAKQQYGVEPDLFSFNESNIGIYVGLTPETHDAAIKRIGAYFRKLGLKTKMLLGDATGPRDTYKFALVAASDPDAMPFIGAVAFHSWGGGTPEQYRAWGDLAEWLNLPLLVTELGVDASAYYTRAYDSFHYGLREAQMTQQLLLYARPRGTQFWEFTADYGLARAGAGGAVEPTPRFWLVKQFTDLTPHGSDALTTSSDETAVLFTAFRKQTSYALHILNMGAARQTAISGIPDAQWQPIESTETAQYQRKPPLRSQAGTLQIELPAHSLVTLTAVAQP